MDKTKEAIIWLECMATEAVGLNNQRGIDIMEYCDLAIAALKLIIKHPGINNI